MNIEDYEKSDSGLDLGLFRILGEAGQSKKYHPGLIDLIKHDFSCAVPPGHVPHETR